nr:uncharacterized protein LOC111415303 [Onthophagus taurus]
MLCFVTTTTTKMNPLFFATLLLFIAGSKGGVITTDLSHGLLGSATPLATLTAVPISSLGHGVSSVVSSGTLAPSVTGLGHLGVTAPIALPAVSTVSVGTLGLLGNTLGGHVLSTH